MNIGIYSILSKATGKRLIGQTMQGFEIRFSQHRYKLKTKRHDNSYLQNHYNKYGENDLVYEIIEKTDKLNEREIFWIRHFKTLERKFGFNLREGGNRGKYGDDLKKRVKDGIAQSEKAKLAKEKQAKEQAKEYRFISPSGEEVIITNLRKFCRENNLHQSAMWSVYNSKIYSCKGWTIKNGYKPKYKWRSWSESN